MRAICCVHVHQLEDTGQSSGADLVPIWRFITPPCQNYKGAQVLLGEPMGIWLAGSDSLLSSCGPGLTWLMNRLEELHTGCLAACMLSASPGGAPQGERFQVRRALTHMRGISLVGSGRVALQCGLGVDGLIVLSTRRSFT